VSEASIWLRVTNGVAILSGRGAAVWSEPPLVANALRELLSVVPMTHAQIDLEALRCRSSPAATWKATLGREGDWGELLRELGAAVSDATRGRATWGLGLPSPAAVAAELGDASERDVLKAGLQIAGFLQGFREAAIGFVTVDLRTAVAEKAVAPIFRNAQMYGWTRAAMVADDPASTAGADVLLVDGLTDRFWSGEEAPPRAAVIFGEIPAGIDAAGIVAAGRALRAAPE
jgi:hypothetical protein